MTIIIPFPIYIRMMLYVERCPFEISGLGKIQKRTSEVFFLEDVRIFPQQVSAAHTKLSSQALANFMTDLIEQGENTSLWKCWFHSHATMDVFWSATDEATIADFDMEMPDNNWLISIVMNKQQHLLPRLDLFAPFRMTETLSYYIDYSQFVEYERMASQVTEEIVRFVHVPQSPPPKILAPAAPAKSIQKLEKVIMTEINGKPVPISLP